MSAFTRRAFFGGATALVGGAVLASPFKARHAKTGSGGGGGGSMPVVGPDVAHYTGAPLSGGTPPTDPTRTTAKAACHWLVPSDLRLVSNVVIGVEADAGGTALSDGTRAVWGIKQVDFWVEGTVQTVTTASFYTDTDANGNSRTRWGHWIALNAAAFRAISTTGQARIFATAVPNDTSMQSRTIGYDQSFSATGSISGTTLTITAVSSGTIFQSQMIGYSGAPSPGPTITAQLSGTPGGVGTYSLDGSYTVASTAINGSTQNGDYPLSVFPRTVANDFIKTIAPSGADYTTIDAAISAARTAAAEAPLLTITQTGNYELTNNPGSPTNYANGKGFCTLTHAPGVVATLGRAAAFSPGSSSTWTWTPGWDGMEFRGAGIVFDQRNFTTMAFTSKAAWYNGCKFTNSIGMRDSFYWNGGTHPGCGTSIPSYWDDVRVDYVSQGSFGLQAQIYAQRCQINQAGGDIFSGTNFVVGNYVRDYSAEYFRAELNSLSVAYNSASGGTAATVTASAGSDVAGRTLSLAVTGASGNNLTLTLGTTGADTYPTIQSVVDAINAWGHGWTAAVLNSRGGMRPSTIGAENGHLNPSASNAFNTTLNIVAAIGIHGDWWQGYCGPQGHRQNVIIRANTCRGAVNVNSAMFNDDASNSAQAWDHIVKANVWLGTDGSTVAYGTFGVGGAASGANSQQHFVLEDNTLEGEVIINENVAGDKTYCSNRNNISLKVYYPTGSPDWTAQAPWINNFYIVSYQGAVSGGGNAGNVTYSVGGFSALFRDYANGDVRPATGGTLLANLFPSPNPYDGSGVAWSASDVAGARSLNALAPSYPF